MGIVERIKEIEAEMARTQKNKATGYFPNPLPICLYVQLIIRNKEFDEHYMWFSLIHTLLFFFFLSFNSVFTLLVE